MKNSNRLAPIVGAVVVLAIIVALIVMGRRGDEDVKKITPTTAVQPALQSERPKVPEAEIPKAPVTGGDEQPARPKLPTLDASDQLVRDQMLALDHRRALEGWLRSSDLLRRSAAYTDGLSRGVLLSKIFPLSPPKGSFVTHHQDGNIYLNAGNYSRYNKTVDALVNLDISSIANLFHYFRPLLEQAFAEMGYSPRQMDGTILQSLDLILATPVIVEPIVLKHDSVTYTFADPALEKLLPLQKQLIRSGPENTRKIQQQARALKEALLNP